MVRVPNEEALLCMSARCKMLDKTGREAPEPLSGSCAGMRAFADPEGLAQQGPWLTHDDTVCTQ